MGGAAGGVGRRVGLLVGRERSFPDALIAEVNKRGQGVEAVYAELEATRAHEKSPYDVLLDRISHDVTCYQPVLKVASLHGTRVINNPFWRIADDKFFNVALAGRLGVKAPKTVVLPSKSFGDDVNSQSLTNLRLVDWKRIEQELGFPMFLKPHWGGGWKSVSRVRNFDELFAAYDQSGRLTMMLQQEIKWVQYVRCLVVGGQEVRPALWDPRQAHLQRYTEAPKSMPPLTAEVMERVVADARKLNLALGYDMNTVEFAITEGGDAYAIDFMNSAPDLDVSSLGEEHFAWVVEKMADLVIRAALDPSAAPAHHWNDLLGA